MYEHAHPKEVVENEPQRNRLNLVFNKTVAEGKFKLNYFLKKQNKQNKTKSFGSDQEDHRSKIHFRCPLTHRTLLETTCASNTLNYKGRGIAIIPFQALL